MRVSLRVLRRIWSRVLSLHNKLGGRLYEVYKYMYIHVRINKNRELGIG